MLILENISKNPFLFHYLRKIPEFNFLQTKERIKNNIRDKEAPILDIGCGTGEFCRLFSPEKYIGVDIAETYVKFALKHYPGYIFKHQNGKCLKFPKKSFVPFSLIRSYIT